MSSSDEVAGRVREQALKYQLETLRKQNEQLAENLSSSQTAYLVFEEALLKDTDRLIALIFEKINAEELPADVRDIIANRTEQRIMHSEKAALRIGVARPIVDGRKDLDGG